jgi:hypothetical protein
MIWLIHILCVHAYLGAVLPFCLFYVVLRKLSEDDCVYVFIEFGSH